MSEANDILMRAGAPSLRLSRKWLAQNQWAGGVISTDPETFIEYDNQGKAKEYPSGDLRKGIKVLVQTNERIPGDPKDDGVRTMYIQGRRMVGAVREAVLAANARGLSVGGTLLMRWVGTEAVTDQRGQEAPSDATVWQAHYTLPAAPVPGGPGQAQARAPQQHPGQPAPAPQQGQPPQYPQQYPAQPAPGPQQYPAQHPAQYPTQPAPTPQQYPGQAPQQYPAQPAPTPQQYPAQPAPTSQQYPAQPAPVPAPQQYPGRYPAQPAPTPQPGPSPGSHAPAPPPTQYAPTPGAVAAPPEQPAAPAQRQYLPAQGSTQDPPF